MGLFHLPPTDKEAALSLLSTHTISSVLAALCVGVITTSRRLLRQGAVVKSSPAPSVSPAATGAFSPALKSDDARPVPSFVASYTQTLQLACAEHDWSDVAHLVETLRRCWREQRQVFLCGNGGSAANAIHLANDLLYGIDKPAGHGLRVTALPANPAVLTCLANDIAYEDIFAQQLTVLARPGDVLIAFSGSGNSPNILKALTRAGELGVTSFAILGFNGGRALQLADHPIHFPVHDMQVSEDLQMMIGHMAMQSLARLGRAEQTAA